MRQFWWWLERLKRCCCNAFPGVLELEDALLSPTLDSSERSEVKPAKREGNGNSEQTVPTHAKTSRRTTSLLNLFMSNSQGTSSSLTSTVRPTLPSPTNDLPPHFLFLVNGSGSRWLPAASSAAWLKSGVGDKKTNQSHRGPVPV